MVYTGINIWTYLLNEFLTKIISSVNTVNAFLGLHLWESASKTASVCMFTFEHTPPALDKMACVTGMVLRAPWSKAYTVVP